MTARLPEFQLRKVLEADKTSKTHTDAARKCGLHPNTYKSQLTKAYEQFGAAEAKSSDLPDGFHVYAMSSLFDVDGQIKLQWVKSRIDPQKQEEIIRETINGFVAKTKNIFKPSPAPKTLTSDLLTCYVIGDCHAGMYAWKEETGEDVDTDIIARDIITAADRLIQTSPKSDECLILQLGDFLHADSAAGVTPMSGNKLDVDTRLPRVIRIGIQTLRYYIESALKKHKIVRVRNVAGNHDPNIYIVLVESLKGYYHKEPRVIIEDSARPFWTYCFGKNLIGVTHGHAGPPTRLPGVLAVDAQEFWSKTDFKYVHHGHIHTKRVFEDMGVIVESFRTLTGKDAWHQEQGYRSGREMVSIVYHKDYGEIERHVAGIKMVRALQKNEI